MEKINYNETFKECIKTLGDKKPSLLLHACCGPCLTYPLSVLVKYFNVTVLYVNPNIYPKEEYELRYKEVKRFVEEYSKDEGIKILVDLSYRLDLCDDDDRVVCYQDLELTNIIELYTDVATNQTNRLLKLYS